MVDNGYDVSDYDEIHKMFGTMEDMEWLIDKVHDHGLKIIIDLVINHTSDEHPWFTESRSSRDNPKRDWYIWNDPVNGKEPNNWAADFGGSAWEFDETTGQYYLHSFSKHQPDLNWHNEEVKKEIFEMIERWLKRGVDGFRMDMASILFKAEGFPDKEQAKGDTREFVHPEHLIANQPGMHELLREMHEQVLAPYGAMLYGEMYFLDPEEGLKYVGYDRGEMELLYQYHIMDARGNWPAVKYHVREWASAFAGKAWNSITFSNHDSPRSVSIYGDSFHHHEKSAKLIATFLLTAPGTPFFLQGEEIGMTNRRVERPEDFTDIKMRGLYEDRLRQGWSSEDALNDLSWWDRDNARTPMQWSVKINGGFSESEPWLAPNPNYHVINVEQQLADPFSILNYYKTMIRLRKEHPALVYGSYEPLHPDDWTVYGFKRIGKEETVVCVFNFSSDNNSIETPDVLRSPHVELLLANYAVDGDLGDTLAMQPWETRVYRIKE